MPGQFKLFLDAQANQNSRQRLFETIWTHYYSRLAVFIRGMISSPDADVEDLIQEILLKVFRNLHRYKPRYSFNTWIYRIARNHCLDYLDKRQNYLRVVQTLQRDTQALPRVPSVNSPEEQILESELVETIDCYMGTLSSEDRQIAMLRFYESMNYRDIGSIMNKPAGTVKYKVHMIRSGLRDFLEKKYER